MAGLPSITVDTSGLPPSSSNKSPPWNAYDASTNRRRVASPALQYPPVNLSPPPLEEGTSQVGDYGDTKHLEHPDRLVRRLSVSHTADDLAQFGARFPETPDSGRLEPWDTRSTGGESISLRSNGETTSTLSDLIREKRKVAVSTEGRFFYPIGDLEEVVTRTAARQELGNGPDVDVILDHIFVPRTISNHKTRAFKIFIILTLMDKSEAIRDFIDDEIYDLDLPFERPSAEGALKSKNQYIRNPQILGRIRNEIGIFKRWTAADTENFVEKQHSVCVPIFDFDTKPGAPVSHYNLHGQTILPYIENDENGLRGEGRSDVWRIKIHPAHIICQGFGPNMSLAVKQLKHRVGKPLTEEAEKFIKEARNLRRFANRDHDFIIKLLCTFQWRGHYYFLFPWADGNLYDFWIRHPDPLANLKQPSSARWLSTQCLGLARALKDIHHGDSHSTLHLAPNQKNHGKHGDIKPENILYFKTDSNDDATTNEACRVHLKISDLGEAEFHSTTSMEVDAMGVLHTPSYSAPELRVKKVSMPNYDIFSLACVLLEFITWYIHGFDGVKKFHEKRLKEREEPVYSFHGDFKVDSFFKHVTVRMDENRHIGAMHKSSVIQEIEELLQDQYCSDYISDLLIFIKDHLLRMNPKNRANCDTIYNTFEDLDKQCRAHDDYCVEKLKQVPARVKTDISVVAEIEFTGEHIIKIMTDAKVGESGQVQIMVEKRADKRLSHPPQAGSGSLPATSVQVGPIIGPQTHRSLHLASIEELPMGPDVREQQHRADIQPNPARPEDAVSITSTKQGTSSFSNQDAPPKISNVDHCARQPDIPATVSGEASSGISNQAGRDFSQHEEGSGRRMWSLRRIFGRATSERDRAVPGNQGVKARLAEFLRTAFCFNK